MIKQDSYDDRLSTFLKKNNMEKCFFSKDSFTKNKSLA